ncbi:MAG: type II toxin-antitoxin system VapC family toxin [Blastocatellia bacterium]
MPDLYLFDTNILVHLVRDDLTGQEIRAKFTPYTRDPKPLICVVTDGELRSLSLQFRWGSQKIDKMNFALDYFGRVPIEPKEVLETYAAIDAYSKAKGIKMGKNDIWIAASAVITNARILTTDEDFDHLDPDFIAVDRLLYA